MSDAVERLVNLALFLADTRAAVTAERIRAEVEGYPDGQDHDAFIRMFERDKDELRAMGFRIEADTAGSYWLDTDATFAAEVPLSAEDATTVRLVGLALLEDPAFPFTEDLRFALAKISASVGTFDTPVAVRTADEDPHEQGATVAALDRAATDRKRVEFDYTNAHNERKHHHLEPYGLFLRDGRWYAVGRDTELDKVRVYTVPRIEDLVIDTARPRTADFERPSDFDVSAFIRLPFQYGPDNKTVTVRFDSDATWRIPGLTGGFGTLTDPARDGSVEWSITAGDGHRFLRWVLENGPGLRVTAPAELTATLSAGLASVAQLHEQAKR